MRSSNTYMVTHKSICMCFMHVQLINLRDFRPATFAEVTAIHSERYVNMLEEVRMLYAAACAGASMDRAMHWRGCRRYFKATPDRLMSNPSRSCQRLLQVVLTRAPTLVDADTYITPSSFDDAIKARPCPLDPCNTPGLLTPHCSCSRTPS